MFSVLSSCNRRPVLPLVVLLSTMMGMSVGMVRAKETAASVVRPLASVSINMRDYMTQPLTTAPSGIVQPDTGSMICGGPNLAGNCMTSFYRGGQYEVVEGVGEANSVFNHDYYAELTMRGVTQIGIVRNSNSTNGLRCFSVPGSPCTAPPTSSNIPEGVPVLITLNSVTYAAEKLAENSNGTPRTVITGAISPTGGSYVSFQNNNLNPTTCAQVNQGYTPALVTAVFVTGVPFLGNVGTQNAVVIDEFELGPTASLNHLERYYYVHGYGRVRESASQYDVRTGFYDLNITGATGPINSVRSYLVTPSTILPQPEACGQSSNPLMFYYNQ